MMSSKEMELKRKPFLINRALNGFLQASVFSAVAIQMAVMVDAIIVANFVGPDAMSAINLCTPVVAILVNVGYMVSMGSTLLMSKAIGENRMEHSSHIAVVAMTLLSSLGLLLAVAGCMLSDWTVSLLCSDASIGGYAKTYLRLFFLLDLLPLFIYNAVCGFTEADGSPQVVTRSVVVGGVVNVVLDLLFVGFFHWGIAGAMYATVINDLLVVVLVGHHLYRHSRLRYSFPRNGFSTITREIFSEGVPLTVGEVVLMTGLMILNAVIIYTLGSGGMFIWSVCMEIFTLVLITMSGVETSMISIGGFLVGDEDVTGLRMLVNHALRVVCMLLLVLTAAILIWPEGVAMAFGARGADSIGTLSQALRIFSLALVPIGIINVMRVVFQLLGHRFASGTLFTSQMLMMDIIIGGFAFLVPAYTWWAFPFAGALMMVSMLAYTTFHYRSDHYLSPFTLVPRRPPETSLDFSMPYQIEALDEGLRRIHNFVVASPQLQGRANDVELTCEEIMKNIIQHTQGRLLKRYFDVHLHRTDEKLVFVIKDAGSPFNPLEHLPQNNSDLNNPQFGIRILSSTCEKLNYKYMWGQNMMLGTFHAND